MPMGVPGQPSAWAIGRGMAKVSGVRMAGLASAAAMAGCPCPDSALFSTPPHAEAAGVQMTGLATVVADSGHPAASCCSAAPDDTLSTCTLTQPTPAGLASFDLLKAVASVVIRSNFSGDDATSTWVQPPPADEPLGVHPAQRAATTATAARVRFTT